MLSFLPSTQDLYSSPVWPVVIEGVLGACIGALIGLVVRMFARRDVLDVVGDAVLGGLGFVSGAIATLYIPWKINTVTYRVGDAIISTTRRRYQHPYVAGFVLAFALPILYEVVRLLVQKRVKD